MGRTHKHSRRGRNSDAGNSSELTARAPLTSSTLGRQAVLACCEVCLLMPFWELVREHGSQSGPS